MNIDLSTLGPLAASLARAGLPALGTLAGVLVPPPFNMAVGPMVSLIGYALGVDPTAPDAPKQMADKIDADPVKAKEVLQPVEDQHKEMADAANAELQMRLTDTQNARSAELTYAAEKSPIQWGAPVVSTVVVAGFIGIMFALIFVRSQGMSDFVVSVITVLVGALAASFQSVVNFWIGSSAGSKDKSTALISMARAPTVNAAAGSHVAAGTITSGKR